MLATCRVRYVGLSICAIFRGPKNINYYSYVYVHIFLLSITLIESLPSCDNYRLSYNYVDDCINNLLFKTMLCLLRTDIVCIIVV